MMSIICEKDRHPSLNIPEETRENDPANLLLSEESFMEGKMDSMEQEIVKLGHENEILQQEIGHIKGELRKKNAQIGLHSANFQ